MMSIGKSLVLIALGCFWLVLSDPAFAEGPLDLELQLKTGDEVPGLEGQIERILEVSSGQPGSIALRVGLTQPGGIHREAVVLKSSEGIQKIIAEGDQLPGGAGVLNLQQQWESDFRPPYLQMSSNGAVGLVLAQGIFLFEDGALHALAVKGQDVPGTGSTIDGLMSWWWEAQYYEGRHTPPAGASLNTSGQIAFAALLSDGRAGVFLASRKGILPVLVGGDPVPGREGLKFERDVAPGTARFKGNHLAVAVYDEQFGLGVFHYASGLLSTVLIGTDDVGGRGRVGYLACFDGNEKGSVALGINLQENENNLGPAELVLWSATSGIKTLLDASSSLPGIETGVRTFGYVFLDVRGALVCAAQGPEAKVGFYYWEDGKVEKIVVEGDPFPTGGTFSLVEESFWIPGARPQPFPNLIYLSPPNSRKEVAFMARSSAGGLRRSFLWSGGSLLPTPVAPADLPGFGGRPLNSMHIDQLTVNGRLLVTAQGCCDNFEALYATTPAFPRVSYLPFFAAGSIPGYSYDSVIQLANRSHFTGHVLIEAFQENGQAEQPQELVIEPGEVRCVSLAQTPFRRGYARVTIDGGAVVVTEGLTRASHDGNNFDLVVPSAHPTTRTDFVLDGKSQNTAVALANPGDEPTMVTMRLYNRKRRLQATESVNLAPYQQSSFLITDIFGPEAGVDHRLRLESDSGLLAAIFSLNGFRFTPLPAAPASSPASGALSLVNVYPGKVEAVTGSPRGTIAFATQDGRPMVVRHGIAARVPHIAPVSEDSVSSPEDYRLGRIVGFREVDGREELLFVGVPEDNKAELIAWNGDELRSLIQLGPFQPATGRTLYPALEIAELNPRGDLLVGALEVNDANRVIGRSFLLCDGTSFREIFTIPGITEVASVAFNSDRQVAVLTGGHLEKKTLGFFDGQEYRTIAEVGSQPLVDWWRPDDFIQMALAEDGTVYLAASVRQTMEAPRTGIFAVKNGTVRTGLVGSVSPDYELASIESPFQINSRGNIAFETRLGTSIDPYGPTAFLVLENTTLQTSVVVAPLPPARGFQWTDNDELFFSAQLFRNSESGLYCWKGGELTTLMDGSDSLLNTPGAAVSPSHIHWDIWPVPGFDAPIISVYTYASVDAPEGLYVGVRGGVRELFFPQVLGAGDGSANTEVTLTNEGDATQVWLQVPNGNGGTHFAEEVPVARKEDTFVPINGDEPFAGWLLARSAGGDINARLGLSLFEGTSDYVRLAVPFSVPRRECFTATPPVNFGELGLAFANPYSAPAEVTVELLGPGMEVERQESVQLEAQGQKSLYVSEIFGEQVPGKLLRIKANFPVATFAAVQSPRGVAVQPVF